VRWGVAVLALAGCYGPHVESADGGADGRAADAPGGAGDGAADDAGGAGDGTPSDGATNVDVLGTPDGVAGPCFGAINGSSCSGGICLDKACATTICFIQTNFYDDGDLDPANSCQRCEPSTSRTEWTPRSDGSMCSGAAIGKCRGGACCTGCWDGFSCVAGTLPSKCGDGGDACAFCEGSCECNTTLCPSQGDLYRVAACNSGNCDTSPTGICCGGDDAGTCGGSCSTSSGCF
jgi:hypothetical protein